LVRVWPGCFPSLGRAIENKKDVECRWFEYGPGVSHHSAGR